ncbi:MAG: hypothetical protein K6F96_01950 [Bacteroidales bacterium]|nr:hypothetical protein [Bacteroidales bacterium]
MRKSLTVILLCCVAGLYSCKNTVNGIDLDIHDPQHILWVEDVIDDDLLELFGEEHIHFGHTPPNLDGVSFMVNGLFYDTCVRYRKVTINGVSSIEPSYVNPGFENSVYKHHFFHQDGNIIQQRMFIEDHNHNQSLIECDTTYLVGSGDDFSVYFKWKIYSEQEGNPTWAFLVSGTLVYDSTSLLGIKDYRIGKKIIDIEIPPVAGYYPGTCMILHPYNTTIPFLPLQDWDTIQ